MEFNITSPALLFSAISLLMLAYTNRFLAIASLVRQFLSLVPEESNDSIAGQIANFRVRLQIIKYTQLFGVMSFFLCVLCMFLVFAGAILAAEIVFAASLVLLMASLLFSLYEIFISIDALKLALEQLRRD